MSAPNNLVHWWLFCLVMLPAVVTGQTVRFRHVTNQDGLSQNTVTAIAQDSVGFLWIGTQDGLNRYDGSRFLVFKHQQHDSTSLATNWITALLIDTKGRKWVGSNGGGLQVLFPGTTRFATVINAKTGRETGTMISAIAEDDSGGIWAATTDGYLTRVSVKGNSFILSAHGIPSRTKINSLKRFRKNRLIAATHTEGVQILQTPDGTFQTLQSYFNLPKELPFSKVLDVFVQDSAEIYVGTDGEGVWMVREGKNPERILLPEEREGRIPPVRIINKDGSGKLWFGTDGFGAYRYDLEKKTIDSFGAYFSDDYSLSDNSIYSSLLDRQGIFWLGTFLGGLNAVDPFNNRFLTLGVTNNPKRTLSNPMVRALAIDESGKLWIGTRGGGINIYTPGVRTVERPYPENLMDQRINALLFDSRKRMWAGTWGGGLYVMEQGKIKRHFTADPDDPKRLPDNRIRTIFEDSKGRIWIATGQIGLGSLVLYNESTADFSRLKLNRKGQEDPAINTVNHLMEDSRGRIWVSTFGGLLRISEGSGSSFLTGMVIEYFRNDNRVPGSLGHNTVSATLQRKNGEIWLATYGLGIAKITETENQQLQFSHVTEEDGLPTNGTFSLLEDNQGTLWIGTNKGIVKYVPETGKIRPYFKSDGITSNQINQGAAFKGFNGVLFFGTAGGLTLFNPVTLSESDYQPEIVLTDIQVFGKSEIEPLLAHTVKELVLPHFRNFLSFEFAALDFSAPDAIQYQCYLEPFDGGWNSLGNRRIINYTNLNPGKYTFRIRATNSDGVWSSKETTLRIEIVPPFWQRPWFYVSVFFLLGAALFSLFLYKEYTHKRLTERLEKAVQERTAELEEKTRLLEAKSREADQANRAKSAFLAGMSHELRTPLNAILGFSQILVRAEDLSKRYREFAETMYRSGNHLLSMINDVLDISKIEAGRMEIKPHNFDIVSMLSDLEQMFKLECRQKGLSFKLELDPMLPSHVHGDSGKLRQVLINLIGNAVKYTASGGVTFSVQRQAPDDFVARYQSGKFDAAAGETFWFIVRDTGQGIPPAKIGEVFEPFRRQDDHTATGTGLGLAITAELVRLMHGMILVDSEPGKGSVFIAALPLQIADAPMLVPSRDALNYVRVEGEKTWKVLIIDDIPSNVELLRVMLEKLGFACIIAGDGASGLESYDREKPDLVLLDLRMPGMRGEEVMKTIRSKPDGKTVPIFAVTASVFEGNQASLIADGFTAFLVKPFHQNDLLDLIEQKTPIRFVKETFQTNTRKPVVEMATVVEWLKALPESDQLRLVEAIQISDADAVLRLAGVYRAFSSEAEFLCRISEDSNYKKLLELAELLEKENLG